MIAKAIALALIDETGLMGYTLPDIDLSEDEINFVKSQNTQQDCNSFCSPFGYYRYNPSSKICKCSHWVNTTRLQDKIKPTQNAQELNTVYLTQPSLQHWDFNDFTIIQQDTIIPSMITLGNAELYDPKLFKQPRVPDQLRCHTMIGQQADTLDVTCAVDMCFVKTTISYGAQKTVSSFTVEVLEQVTKEWHTRTVQDNFATKFDDELLKAPTPATITNLDGAYNDECSTLKDIEDSEAVWDKYSEQRGAFVVTIIDFERNEQGSGKGGQTQSGAGNPLTGNTNIGNQVVKGKDSFIVKVDVVTDRVINTARCKESRNFHGFFFFQMHSSTTLYAESTIVVQMLCKVRFVSKCLNQKLCEFKV